jgi:DNA helicase-2/ATP-dependent DNA helicase PcrA
MSEPLPENQLPDLSTLTPEQASAVHHPGDLLVTAGAGGGKTHVLALRIAHLVSTGLCDPFNVLAVTFSVRAARELRARLADLVRPERARLMTVCTLHALGLKMLRESGDLLGFDLDARRRKPRVLSQVESRTMVATLIKDVARELSQIQPSAAAQLERLSVVDLAGLIAAAKANGISPEAFAGRSADPVRAAVAACYAVYQSRLKVAGAVDFGDLILQPLRLLDRPQALDFYQVRWQHILVDEFQDTSRPQYEILRRLAGGRAQLTVIGDACQSVYGFRGAMGGEGFERFRRDFAGAKAIFLPHNFRSSANIVALGDALLSDLKPRQQAVKPGGLPVVLLRVASEHEEAATVAGELARAVRSGFTRYDECAVLCRTNAQIALLEHALLHANVPYHVVGQGAFFDHAEIRQVLSYLSLTQGSAHPPALCDDHALRAIVNVPPRGLGRAEIETLKGDAPELTAEHLLDSERVATLGSRAQAGVRSLLNALGRLEDLRDAPPSTVIDFVLADDGIGLHAYLARSHDAAHRLDRVRELWRMAASFERVTDFLDEVDVMSGQDPLTMRGREQVQVMTLHQAKGLEFRLVFLAGLEEGCLPHYYDQDSRRGLEEERRLCYVGFTRATDALCMTYVRTRGGKVATPSRFLQGLPAAIISRRLPAWNPKEAQPCPASR